MIHHLLNDQLKLLHNLIQQLETPAYTRKSVMLNNSSIGQHVRHIVELVQCLVSGYEDGRINYDARKRDVSLETNQHLVINWIELFISNLQLADKPLVLIREDDLGDGVRSSYYREIFYNTEHAIHHMALIRVALNEMKLNVADDQFGVAPSTIKYRQGICAQ